MNRLLNGRRALVCGASAGIGRATAIALAEQGAEIIALARRVELLEALPTRPPGRSRPPGWPLSRKAA